MKSSKASSAEARFEWVVIGDYAVCNDGTIKMLRHEYKNRWGGISFRTEKVLAQSNDIDGYKLVTMKRLGWTKNGQVRVHRLVAYCFLGPRPDGKEINHIDGNKFNNCAHNLEYVSSKENKIHAVHMGLMKTGKLHHKSRTMIATKDGAKIEMTGCMEAKKHGFPPNSAHRVARGERKSWHGWKIEYASNLRYHNEV